MARTVKVAVVGSGLAGLTSAWLLTRSMKNKDVEFEVHIFEKTDVLGMDAASISFTEPQTKLQWRLDVPMRAFQGGYYPQLIAMYKSIGVKICRAYFSYSFSFFSPPSEARRRKVTTTFIYNGSSGRSGLGFPSSLAGALQEGYKESILDVLLVQVWAWVVFGFMTLETLFCFLTSAIHAAPFLRSPGIQDKSFGEWVQEVTPSSLVARWIGLDVVWKNYVRDVLIPMWSGVCTATAEDIVNYPAEELLDLIWLTIGTPHYVVANGVRDVVAELSKGIKHIHVSSPIISMTTDPDAPHLASVGCATASGGRNTFNGFHHVIFATEAKTAAFLLNDFGSKLQQNPHTYPFGNILLKQAGVLSKFQYRTVVVINHTDSSLLPDDPRDHRELNFISYHGDRLDISEEPERDSSVCVSSSYTMVTHVLPKPEGYPQHSPAVYQTTNPYIPPEKNSILSYSRLERAVPTVEAKKVLQALCEEKERRWWECPAIAKTKLGPLQGAGRLSGKSHPGIWICGSYAFPGIPLLEGCVVSAKNVVVQGILECEGTELREEPWRV